MIGITTYGRDKSGNFYLPGNYVDAVRMAGGLPVLLTPGEKQVSQIYDQIDGVIFAGGGDINPKRYGGEEHPAISRVDDERDAFEFELAEYAVNREKPVLGICRGFQMLNVATGGDLVQHVPETFGREIIHVTDDGVETKHEVKIDPKSRLGKMVDAREVIVVSKHHQAAQSIPNDWQIVAQSPDAVIEAFEHKEHPWLIAVLWHPEMALEDSNQQRIFQEFVKATSVTN